MRPQIGFDTRRSSVVRYAGRAPKESWVTRRMPHDLTIDWESVREHPRIGDILLCEVVQTSLHGRLETRRGDRAQLYAGDLVICAVGSRYATALLEGVGDISGPRADLLSASGVCGRVIERSDKTARPTELTVLAQAWSNDVPLSLRSFCLDPVDSGGSEPAWILVVGSAMDSGKTTACTTLINGLVRQGLRVGAAKLTGTASCRDVNSFRDAGADPVLDFLDCGWPSTAGCSTDELASIARTLTGTLKLSGVDACVIEIADGLLQPETEALIDHLRSTLSVTGVILTVRESLAAVAGVERLAARGLKVSAVSGVASSSPLACREIELATGLPCVRTSELGSAAALHAYLNDVIAAPARRAPTAV